MVTKRLAPLFLVSIFLSSQVLAQDGWGHPNQQDSDWPMFSEDVLPPEPSPATWDNFFQESNSSEKNGGLAQNSQALNWGYFQRIVTYLGNLGIPFI
jgi:hypothetical protein